VKDLLIRVEEKPNLHFEVGGGVATDRGATVFARAGHRNLFGLGHRVTGLAQAGLGWVGDGWALDVVAPVWRAAARYEAPNLPGRGERLALDLLFNERAQEPTFRLERTGAAASARLRLGASDSASVAYRVQARRLMDVDPGAFVNGDPWLDEIGIDVLDDDPHPTTPSDFRFQSGFEVSAVHDRRDDPFNPSRGSLGSIVLMLTDRLASDTVFLKAEGSWTQWAPVGPVGLMLRGRAGVGWVPGGESTLPLEERFRLGGGSTMRGFDLDTVGPANSVSRERVEWPDALGPIIDYAGRDDGARWVPTGGDTMGLLSAELRLPFERMGLDALSGSQLALFSDVGNVWFLDELAAPGSAATDPLLRWSVGLGVRRTTAIGPVEVDVGFNPARLPDRGEELLRLHVSLGAQ
jgi:outer membrane protein assembly factor BamA